MIEYRIRYQHKGIGGIAPGYKTMPAQSLKHAEVMWRMYSAASYIEECVIESRYVSDWVVR